MPKKKDDTLKIAEYEKGLLHAVARIYIIFVTAVYPLYVTNEGYNNIVFRKAQFYWVVSIVFFFIFLCFYAIYRLSSGRLTSLKEWVKGFGIPDYAALSFFLFMTVSCVLSEYQDTVWLGFINRNDGWLTYTCMIVAYFIISRWYKPHKLDGILFAVSSSLVCVIGFLQFYGYDILKLFPYTQSNQVDANGNPRYSGFSIQFRTTLSNIDFVSTYVCMTVIAFGILYIITKGPVKILYAAASVMNFALMIIGGADAGKVGLMGVIALLVPYWIADKRKLGYLFTLVSFWGFYYALHHWIMTAIIFPGWGDDRPIADIALKNRYNYLPLKPVLILSAVSLAIGIFLILYKPGKWMNVKTARIAGAVLLVAVVSGGLATVRIVGQKLPETSIIYEASELLAGTLEDHFGSMRGFIWVRAIKRTAEAPILGSGTDAFIYAFGDENQAEGLEKHGVKYDKAHNDFIQILICNGITGLLSYLALIGSLMILSIKKAFNDDVLLIVAGCALGYIGQSFFGIDTVIVTPLYWLALAVVRNRQMQPAAPAA